MRISTLQNAVFQWVARIFAPGLAEQMRREGSFYLAEAGAGGDAASDHVIVEDRGSDVTLFVFSGLAVLFAGMPRFEFRKLLLEGNGDYNLVFFRDLRRTAYHVTPDGRPGGYAYYEALINEIKARLGSKRHVALGASSGGSAAFYFGSRCGMDKIVTFSPAFPHTCYTAPWAQVRTYFDLWKLVTEPSAYLEVVMVTLGAIAGAKRLARLVPEEEITGSALRAFLNAAPRPRATIFYGARCRPDRDQASRLAGTEGLTTVAVASGRHNCAADLKKAGKLAAMLLAEIEEGIRGAVDKSDKSDKSDGMDGMDARG